MPQSGVYIALADLDGRCYTAILNQGTHPTTPEGNPTIEAHLLDFEGGDLYGRNLTLTYVQYLRPEIKFPSLEALKEQMVQDREDARAWARQSGDRMNQSELVTLQEVSYRYDEDTRQAVDNVTMDIRQGEFVAVLGHNGSGKIYIG